MVVALEARPFVSTAIITKGAMEGARKRSPVTVKEKVYALLLLLGGDARMPPVLGEEVGNTPNSFPSTSLTPKLTAMLSFR